MKKESPNPSHLPLSTLLEHLQTRFYLVFLALPLVLWAILFALRPHFYHAWCAVDPSPCTIDSVNSFDRIVFQFGSKRADYWSNVVQNCMGVVAYALPWLWYGRKRRQQPLRETLLLTVVTFWNLFTLELTRLFAQRPRPLVYNAPLIDGGNIHQYTSFYSGHTSFTALATLCLYFAADRRFQFSPNRRLITFSFFALYLGASTITGALRILGGRHYPTDVLAGFAVGTLLACGFNFFFGRRGLGRAD